MTVYSANKKPLPEYDIDPGDIPLVMARAAQLPGVTTTEARNLGGWLVGIHAALADSAASRTKSRFRRILRELAATGDLPDPPTPARQKELVERREAEIARMAARKPRGRSTAAVAANPPRMYGSPGYVALRAA